MPSKAIGVSRASAKPKIRAAQQVQLDESLEEALCNYIDNSEVYPGEGMTLDHLSREDSFQHPDKPRRKGSQRVLKTLLEGCRLYFKTHGKVRFVLNSQKNPMPRRTSILNLTLSMKPMKY